MNKVKARQLCYTIQAPCILRNWLSTHLSARIATFLKKELGVMQVNGEAVTAKAVLKTGDELTLTVKERCKPFSISKPLNIEVLYCDEDVLIVSKARGITTMPTNGHYEDCIFAGLTYLYPNEVFRIVTRLDKDTCGLVLVARNAVSHSILAESKIDKLYRATLLGAVPADMVINAPIARGNDITRIIAEDGKPSTTILKVLGYTADGNTLANFQLITGRTHQIRVHAAYIGHPVIGDTLYGNGTGGYNSGQELTCYHISFAHPITNERITVEI